MNRFLSDEHLKAMAELEQAGLRPNSVRARESDLRYFWAYAQVAHGVAEHYPTDADLIEAFVIAHLKNVMPDSVREQLVALGYLQSGTSIGGKHGHKLSTLQRRLTSLRKANALKGIPAAENPVLAVRAKLAVHFRGAGISGEHSTKRKQPLTAKLLKRLYDACETSALVGIRDRAMIALAYATGGRRREEVTSILRENVLLDASSAPGKPRYLITLSRTKTSRQTEKVLAGDAAIFLQDWLEKSVISSGPLFPGIRNNGKFVLDQNGNVKAMTGTAFWKRVKHYALRAGLDPDHFSPHSIRAGFVTDGLNKGKAPAVLKKQTGHRSDSAFSIYYRNQEVDTTGAELMDEEI